MKHDINPILFFNLFQPNDIVLPSGLQYYLEYNEEGNLKLVRTPGLGRHYFFRLVIFESQRYFYRIPMLDLPYIEDYNGNGKLQQIVYPSEYRKVVYRYNHFAQPVKILFGETEIKFQYDADIAMKSLVEVNRRGYRLIEAFSYDSSLIASYSTHFPDDYRLLNVKHDYTYDKNFRLVAIESHFSQNQSKSTNFSYDETSGLLKNVKYLKFQWPLVDREKIMDDHVVISRELDLYGRLHNVRYMFRDDTRFQLTINYDDVNRISSWNRNIGLTDVCQYQYRYDIDGNIINVIQNGETKWKYGYDNNGNINHVGGESNTYSMDYDAGDKIKSFGTWRYKFDQDGFMIQRHDEDLLFNANGQLESVSNSGLFKYSYNYDHVGRLIVQRNRLGDIMQYFYADVSHPSRLTHTYNHTTLELTQYFYDSSGRLIAFERQEKLNYVATDPMGSPIVIFDGNGLIVKQLSYDPLGQVVSDSNPNYEFSIGFQGGIYNSVTKLAHYQRQVYDTMIGHYVSPDYRRTMRDLQFLMEDPTMMNNYQKRFLVNTHLRDRKFPTLGVFECYFKNGLSPDKSLLTASCQQISLIFNHLDKTFNQKIL